MFKFIRKMAGKVGSFSTVKQARAARKLEAQQVRRIAAGKKVEKTSYTAGSIGLSGVASDITREFGHIINRRQRKKIAKNAKKPFIVFTITGKPDHTLSYQVGRQLQKSNAYFAKIKSKSWRKAAGDR